MVQYLGQCELLFDFLYFHGEKKVLHFLLVEHVQQK
jgi:hypothetical protein